MLRAFGHPVAMSFDMLGVVGVSQQHLTCVNTLQHDGQAHVRFFAEQCCDMLRPHVAIVLTGALGWAAFFISSHVAI